MSNSPTASKLANQIARVPGVATAVAASSFSSMHATAVTEYESEVNIEGYGRDWAVEVVRVTGREDSGPTLRTVLTPEPYAVKGTAVDAVRFGIAFGIGHSVAS